MSDADRQRALAAERQRRRRVREALDQIVVPVPVAGSFIALLVERGMIDERRAWDRSYLATVIARLAGNELSRVTEETSSPAVESAHKSGKG